MWIFRGVNILSDTIPVPPDTPIFLSVDEQLGNRERNIFFSQIPHDGVIAAGKVDIGKGDITNVKHNHSSLCIQFYVDRLKAVRNQAGSAIRIASIVGYDAIVAGYIIAIFESV